MNYIFVLLKVIVRHFSSDLSRKYIQKTVKELKRVIILFIMPVLFLCHFVSTAQNGNGNMVVKIEDDIIKLKWYSQELVYPKGVNIFRKEENGNWVKLNSSPIKKGKPIEQSILNNDEELKQSYEIVKDIQPTDFKSIILLNTIVQSFKSDEFADFLGIYFEDKFSTTKKVKYKVVQLDNEIIAETEYISLENWKEFAPPKNIVMKKNRRKVGMSWNYEETKYWAVNIYRAKNNEEFVKINEYPILQSDTKDGKKPKYIYEDEKLDENTTYSYYLKGLGFFGEESEKSKVYTFQIKDETPPTTPYQLRKVDVKKNKVELKWKNSSFLSDAVGNNIYRSTHVDTGYVKVNNSLLAISDTNFTDTVHEGQGYFYYKVGAIDASGNVGYSDPIFIEVYDLFAPQKPKNFTVISDTGKAIFTWERGEENDLKGYRIYRTINPTWQEGELMLINKDIIDTTFFIDKLPKRARNKFYYFLVALDENYNKSEYAGPIKIQLPDVTPPSAPFIKKIYQEENYVMIDFEANIEPDLVGYTLYRKDNKNTQWQKWNEQSIPKYAVKYRDRKTTPDTKYLYYLTATDSTGNCSEISNIVGFKTAKPSTKKDIEIAVKSKLKKRKKKAIVVWQAALAEEELLGCILYKKQENLEFTPLNTVTTSKKLTVKINKDKEHVYQLRVHDTHGNIFRKEFKL